MDTPLNVDDVETSDLKSTSSDDAEWVGWAEFSADVLAGTRAVSTWCREQVPQLVALGSDPHRWPEADDRLLPPAARL